MTALARLGAISLDADDPQSLAELYRQLLDVEVFWESADFVALKGAGVLLTFQRVADHRIFDWPTGPVPKQIHLELSVDDLDAARRVRSTSARRSPTTSRRRTGGGCSSIPPATRSASARSFPKPDPAGSGGFCSPSGHFPPLPHYSSACGSIAGVEPAPDPEGEAPWAMQLVAQLPRLGSPTATAVCEAAATAVVRLLDDERALVDPWRDLITRWTDGRIRKVVRRARGVQWDTAQAVDGVTVDVSGALVRAFVPGPVDAVPAALSRLQVGGTDVPERGDPSPTVPPGLTIAVTPLVAMTTGKAAAQCGHAAQLALSAMTAPERDAWRQLGLAVRVVFPDRDNWDAALAAAIVTVHDGGFTEIPPDTLTTAATWSVGVSAPAGLAGP